MKVPLADETVRSVLRRILEARPVAFSDKSFPVFCLKCAYQLFGNTSGRCPECGTAFDRAELLFEQYELGRSLNARDSVMNRVGRTPAVVVCFTSLGLFVLMCLFELGTNVLSGGHGVRIPYYDQIEGGLGAVCFGAILVILIQERLRWRRVRRKHDELMGIVEEEWTLR